eukprot:scaffold33711_cov54-Attheya_sp.AAC.8
MTSSTFTLEFTVNEKGVGVLNIPFEVLPIPLVQLGVPEAKWTDVYNYAHGLVVRAVEREKIKKELDKQKRESKPGVSFGLSFRKKKKKQAEMKPTFDEQKEEHEKATEKGWNTLLSKANAMKPYGVSANCIRDIHTKQIFGLEFHCDSSSTNNKVVLRYDFRREAWTLPRESLPDTVNKWQNGNAIIEPYSWNSVWDMAQAAIVDQKKSMEIQKDEKNKVYHKLRRTGSAQDDSTGLQFCIWSVAEQAENSRKADFATEKDWKLLESKAQDLFLPLGVMVSLLVHDIKIHGGGDSFMYAGLELRVLPSFSK